MIKILWIALAALLALALVTLAVVLIVRHFKPLVEMSKNDKWLVEAFGHGNVSVYGMKRRGKDLLMAWVIHLRGEPHYANILYNENTAVIKIKDMRIGDNTYLDFMKGELKKVAPTFNEGQDIYLSDVGIYLPCQYNKELNALFPELPIFLALQGQLYDSRTHFKTQDLGRPWDKLREQSDCYIHVLDKDEYEDFFIVHTVCYNQYSAAEACLLPRKNDEQYNATHGEIVKRDFKIYKCNLKYDTRYFRSICFDIKKSPLEGVKKNVTRK